MVLARSDRLELAERLAREALSDVRETEFTRIIADQLMVLADVLHRRGHEGEALAQLAKRSNCM